MNWVVSIETTAGSTLASTLWTSVGWARTLWFGKYFSMTVCCRSKPTHSPTPAPTRAATTAVTPTTQTQFRRVSVWTTRWGGGAGDQAAIPYGGGPYGGARRRA